MMKTTRIWAAAWLATLLASVLACENGTFAAEKNQRPTPLKLLMLGDNGHHRPAARAAQLIPFLAARGIDVHYTDDLNQLTAAGLKPFDGLIIYANHERITPEQEQAILDFVAGGKGLIPLHCASYCFLNSPKYIDLVGAQFQRHGAETFRTRIVAADHPIMRDFAGFESWDETYVHHKHNEKGRTVLEFRENEPWTWVRDEGKGRVFYTAWGHDERTWANAGFLNLVERGIRWACGQDSSVVPAFTNDDAARASSKLATAERRKQPNPFATPKMTALPKDLAPFKYEKADVPFYPPGQAWGKQDPGLRDMQLPLSPAESQQHFVMPEGFELELFVSEPELSGKPIAMNWDERGRLWVCETYDYPNELQPRGQGRDRIRICEDTNGDGKADKFTIFADKLSIPTTLVFHRGGIILQDGMETLYLKDIDGDDKADVRKVLITGWGFADTHGGVSNFQYGLDNWLWGMQGYNYTEPKIGNEQFGSFRMGFFRFRFDDLEKPQGEVEFLRSTNNNTWGLGFSEEGFVFGSTANRNPSDHLPIPNRYYERVRGWSAGQLGGIADTHLFKPITDKVRQVDQHGGYTAGAGHALYTARAYPQPYWNRTAFVCGPTGHLVGTFVLSPSGAGFKSTSPANLVASNDEWTAPIMAEVGPDGNVWIIDWYNYIVQHNPTPAGFKNGKGNAYETDLRDKKHGRIYRLVYKGSDAGQPDKAIGAQGLAGASPDELVAALRSSNLLWRKHAQRLLVERGSKDVVPALRKLIEDETVDEIGLNVAAIHALWTLAGLDFFAENSIEAQATLLAGLRHPSDGVLRNALAVAPPSDTSVNAILASGAITSTNLHVRLAALLALADMPANIAAGKAIALVLTDPLVQQDRWLLDAATSAAAAHDRFFLPAIATQGLKPTGAAFPVVTQVAEHFARGKPTSAAFSDVLVELSAGDADVISAVAAGLSKGWPADHGVQLSAVADDALVGVMLRVPAGAKSQFIKLGPAWGSSTFEKQSAEIAAAMAKTLADSKVSDTARVAAAQQLAEFRPDDDTVARQIVEQITPQASPELAGGLFEALRSSTAEEVGPTVVAKLASWTPQVRAQAIGLLLSRPALTKSLLDGIREGTILWTDLSLDQKQVLANHPDRAIAEIAKKLLAQGGGLPNADREKVVQEFHSITETKGDAAGGKLVFTKQCSKCHTHNGEGTRIGPDLTGMAVHPKHELLIHILDPSRSVEGNFRTYTIVTNEGRIFTGMLASETKTSLELVDAEAKRHAILREDIDELQPSRKSLMPEGFEKQVSREELTNLLEFLTQRGKFVPLDIAKAATLTSARGMFYNEEAEQERLIFDDWAPKTFAEVPFHLVDPQDGKVANVVLLHGLQGKLPPRMPKSVTLNCGTPATAIHLLSGVSGWGFPYGEKGSVSLIVRLHYADGKIEDHPLKNGLHFADYIRRVDVPESTFAFALRDQQLRYLSIKPLRGAAIERIELIKGTDATAPVVVAITVETPQQ